MPSNGPPKTNQTRGQKSPPRPTVTHAGNRLPQLPAKPFVIQRLKNRLSIPMRRIRFNSIPFPQLHRRPLRYHTLRQESPEERRKPNRHLERFAPSSSRATSLTRKTTKPTFPLVELLRFQPIVEKTTKKMIAMTNCLLRPFQGLGPKV